MTRTRKDANDLQRWWPCYTSQLIKYSYAAGSKPVKYLCFMGQIKILEFAVCNIESYLGNHELFVGQG